jgi:DNA replication protein DnaC
MLRHPTLEKLSALRLRGMLSAYEEFLHQNKTLSFEEGLSWLVEREYILRDNKRLENRLKHAKLKQSACIENIDFNATRGLQKSFILSLAEGNWIREHLNVLITGATGTGKTYLACALSHKACLHNYTARYYRLPRLLQEIHIARADGSYSKVLLQLAKIDVLILDDWGLAPLSDEQRRDLLEIIDDRYQTKSLIITSQLPLIHWHEHIGNQTFADAIVDRLFHHSIKIALSGDSLRKNENSICQTQEENLL